MTPPTTLARRRTDDADTTEVAVVLRGRGAVKIDGATWPYLQGGFYVVAFDRMPVALKGATLPFDSEAIRATAASYLSGARDREHLTMSGRQFRELHRAFTDAAIAGGLDSIPVGIGDRVYNFLALALALAAVADDETVHIGFRGDDVLRIDAPRMRLALMCMTDGEAMAELLNKEQLDALESARGES